MFSTLSQLSLSLFQNVHSPDLDPAMSVEQYETDLEPVNNIVVSDSANVDEEDNADAKEEATVTVHGKTVGEMEPQRNAHVTDNGHVVVNGFKVDNEETSNEKATLLDSDSAPEPTTTTILNAQQQAHLLELGQNSQQRHLYVKDDKNFLSPANAAAEAVNNNLAAAAAAGSRRVSASRSAKSASSSLTRGGALGAGGAGGSAHGGEGEERCQ